MKPTTIPAVGLAILGAAQAGVISSRQTSFRFECNGQQLPDIGDCAAVYAIFNDATATYTPISGSNGLFFTAGDDKNCRIDITWSDLTYIVTGAQVGQGINGVQTTCFPDGTGGTAVDIGGRYTIGVRNNPNYDSPEKRSATTLIPIGKRADSDTSYTYGVHTVNAKPASMKHNIGEGIPGGSTWEWSSEKSVTDHVSFSTSVSAGIEDILSASLSTEISHDETYTSGETTTITIKCDDNQYGQVYFQGYAETWHGTLQPSGESLDITKPMKGSDGATSGFYSYDCIAK